MALLNSPLLTLLDAVISALVPWTVGRIKRTPIAVAFVAGAGVGLSILSVLFPFVSYP